MSHPGAQPPGQYSPRYPTAPSYSSAMPPLGPPAPRRQTSPGVLAAVVFLFFVVLAAIIVLVIALV